MSKPPLGFVPEPLILSLSSVLPSRKTPEGLLASRKFKQITASIEAVGLIEPLSVGKPNREGQHILLDGHTRLVALKQLGFDKAPCLVATDDESYTYNNRINRLSSIQEHLMIRRAVERGVTPEKLAKVAEPAQVRRQDAGAAERLLGCGGRLAEGPDPQRPGVAAGDRPSQFFIRFRGLTNDDARCLGPGLPAVRRRHAGAAGHAVATRGICFVYARQNRQANSGGSVFCALSPLSAASGAGLERWTGGSDLSVPGVWSGAGRGKRRCGVGPG